MHTIRTGQCAVGCALWAVDLDCYVHSPQARRTWSLNWNEQNSNIENAQFTFWSFSLRSVDGIDAEENF